MAKDNESTMKWKVDISELKKGMQDAKRSIALANAEFKTATAGMGKWQNSVGGVEAKLKQLKSSLSGQATVLQQLQKQYEIVSREMGDGSTEAQRLKLAIEKQKASIANTQAELSKYNGKLDDLKKQEQDAQSPMAKLNDKIGDQESKLADLKTAYANATLEFGKNSKEAKDLASQIDKLSTELADDKSKLNEAEKAADEFDKSIDEAGKSAEDAANGGFTVMKGALANLVAQGISAALDAMRQLSAAVLDIGKQSIASYSEYEQLTGGVEKLFGDSADQIMQYAADAYRTSGMSANQYMQQATGFSAALIGSLGGDTAKAAEMTDIAMRAMSDNVNVFGSNMQDVQNAYQGFAKANYTMLDNLRLGYGGTKEEMQRLIDDANEYAASIGMASDLSIDSFADIVQAIELIQQKQGIAGATAAEAAGTIEGSLNMAKSAWENLLTGLADSDADVGALFDAFVDSAKTYLQNLLPVVQTLMQQVGELIDEKLREIAPEFMEFVDQVSAFLQDDLLPVLQDVFGWIIDNKDFIIAALTGILTGFLAFKAVTFIQGIPAMLATLKTAILGVNAALAANPIGIVIAAVTGLVAALVYLWNTNEDFRKAVIKIWNSIKKAVKTVADAIVKFFKSAWDNIKKAWAAAGKFFSGIWDGIKKTFAPAVNFFKKLFTDSWNAVKNAWNAAVKFFTDIWNGIKKVFAPVVDFFKTLFGNAWTMIVNIWKVATFFFTEIWNGIKAVFANVASWFGEKFTAALDAVKNIWNGAKGFFSGIWSGIKQVFGDVVGWFKGKFDSAWGAVKKVFSGVSSFFSGVWSNVKNAFGDVVGWFRGKFDSAWGAVKKVFDGVGGFFGGIWETIKGKFSDIGTKVGESIGGAFKRVINTVLSTAESVLNAPINGINSLIDKANTMLGLGLGRLNTFSLPRMALGGVVRNATAAIIGEDGAEAVVPLERNKQWISAVANDMLASLNGAGAYRGTSNVSNKQQVINFTQNNYSPKALDRLSIYRDTKSIFFTAKVGLANV